MKDEKAEVYIRVLDDNGRVYIPIQVRKEMEISPVAPLNFWRTEIWTGDVLHLLWRHPKGAPLPGKDCLLCVPTGASSYQ